MFAKVILLYIISSLFLVQRLCFAYILYEEFLNNKSGNYKIYDVEEEGCRMSSHGAKMDGVRCLGSTSCSVCFYIHTPRFWEIDELQFDFNGNAGTKIVVMSAGFEKEFVVIWDDTWNTYRTEVGTHGPKTFFFIDRDPPCDFQCLSNLRVSGGLRVQHREGLGQFRTTAKVKKFGRWRDEELKVHFILTIIFLTFAVFCAVAMIMCIFQKSKNNFW